MNKEVISKIVQDNNFVQSSVFKVDYIKGVYVASGNIAGNKVLLKIFSKKLAGREKGLNKEILVSRILQNSKTSLVYPEVISSGQNDEFIWIVRRFIDGDSLSSFEAGQPLYGYDNINPEFLGSRSQICDGVVKALIELNKIKIDSNQFPNRYKKNLEEYPIADLEEGLGFEMSEQLSFYNQVKSEYFSSNSIAASLGDFAPSNILISQEKIVISDFEWFSADNASVDAAFFWLFLWKHPDWQAELLSGLKYDSIWQEYFRVSVIRILIGWLSFTFDSSLQQTEKIIELKDFYKYHIWSRYLESAGQSFEKLINTRQEKDES